MRFSATAILLLTTTFDGLFQGSQHSAAFASAEAITGGFHDQTIPQSNVVLGQSDVDVGILSAGSTATRHGDTTTSVINNRHLLLPTQANQIAKCKNEPTCTEDYSCRSQGMNVEINDGSCNGVSACEYVAAESEAEVEISCYSCIYYQACSNLAGNADDSAIFTIKNSCAPGYYIEYAACNELGRYAGANSKFILNNSCNQEGACMDLGRSSSGNVYFSMTNSCNGFSACDGLGEHAGDDSTFVLTNSCLNMSACISLGKNAGAGSSFQIDSNSCGGDGNNSPCRSIGANAKDGSSFHIQSDSCQGISACEDLGFFAPENGDFKIGPQSCIGPSACRLLGRFNKELYIGEGSCIGLKACFMNPSIVSDDALPIQIGAGSCTCDGCCENLQPGSYIGDGQCVTLDDQCADQEGPVIKLSACAALENTACAFSDNPNEQFTSFCVSNNDNHIYTECKRHDIGDEISEISPGMYLPGNLLVLSCGCCDPEFTSMRGGDNESAANEVGNAFASFCLSGPICTPEDGDEWDPCDTIGNEEIRGINVCVDGSTVCLDPFHIFADGESVSCGACPK